MLYFIIFTPRNHTRDVLLLPHLIDNDIYLAQWSIPKFIGSMLKTKFLTSESTTQLSSSTNECSAIVLKGLPWWLTGKESFCQCRRKRRQASIPGLGRTPGEGNGNPFQYSCLGISWTEVPGVLIKPKSVKSVKSPRTPNTAL